MNTQLGLRLRDHGLDAVEHTNEAWLDVMRQYAKRRSVSRQTAIRKLTHETCQALDRHLGAISADDVRQYADEIDYHPESPNAYGALFRESCWRCVGRTKSRHPGNHGREIKLWSYVG